MPGKIRSFLADSPAFAPRMPPFGGLQAHLSYVIANNLLHAIHRLTNANNVVTCAAFLARPLYRTAT